MKKLLLFILGIFVLVPVFGAENKLYFTADGQHIYYDGALLNEKTFMKHLDMVPGQSNTDELIIENGSDRSCKLYFKVIPREQNTYANELLDNINMKILLDGSLVYDGKAKGLDYNSSGVNLQNAIELKLFNSGDTSLMRVETTLSTQYTNPEEDDTSLIDWEFYGQCDEPGEPVNPDPEPEPEPKPTPEPEKEVIKIIEAPKTGISTNVKIYAATVLMAVIILTIVFILDRKKSSKKEK